MSLAGAPKENYVASCYEYAEKVVRQDGRIHHNNQQAFSLILPYCVMNRTGR